MVCLTNPTGDRATSDVVTMNIDIVRVSPILRSLFTGGSTGREREREKDSLTGPRRTLPSNNKDVSTRFYTTLSTHTDFTITFTCHRRAVVSSRTRIAPGFNTS